MPAHLIAETGPHRGLILNLEEGDEWVIGRDPNEAVFVIEDHTVSRKHARLRRSPRGIYLENLSRVSSTLVNDEQIETETLLKEGDRIQIGQTTFLFSEEEIPEIGAPLKKKGGYDDIFGALEEPAEEIPPQSKPEPKEPEEESEEEEIEEGEQTPPAPTGSAYDTIFEDLGEGSELPFNLLSETPLLLKVISGPNAGAEIGLEKGRTYTIGKDSALCDIIFQDLSVSRNHARLNISSEGNLEIEDLGSKNGTVVNGVPITEPKTITTQDLIALGTTVFLIIDREAPQETIYSPMVPVYETPKIEEAVQAAPIQTEEPEAKETKRDWKAEPIPMKHLIAAASLAAIFLIVFLSFFSLFKSKPIESIQKDPSSQIKKALTKFDGVQFSFNPGSGKLFLVGHVLTAIDAQEMRYRLGEINAISSMEENVVIDEMVNKMMNDILSSDPNFRGVTILSPHPGKFVASGYLETNEAFVALSEYLSVNFSYLDRLANQVVVGENLNAQLQAILLSQGLGTIAFQYTNGQVILTGNYSDKMESEFKEIIKQISKIPGVSVIKNYASASTPNLAAIDVSKQFQVSGLSQYEGRGYSVILNGKIYSLGDAVGGMTITEIDPNTILLEKDGIKYKINYTR